MLNIFLASLLTISVGTLSAAPSNEKNHSVENEKATKTFEAFVRTLDNVMENSVNGIPQSLINKSEGMVILPGACQVAAGAFNGPGGRGIAMIHNDDGTWSNPFFVTLREGSMEFFKMGVQHSDIVLFFEDRNDITGIEKADITLGSDVGVAAGPVQNGSSSSSDITFEREIYSYHWSNGHFAGVSLKGGVLSYSAKPSDSLFCIENTCMEKLLYEIETPYYDTANDQMVALNMDGK
jgi:lipid-binding SYLF domain-containing protein